MRIGIDVSVAAFNSAGNARYARMLLASVRRQAAGGDLTIVPLDLPRRLRATGGWQRKALVVFWELVYVPWLLPALCRRAQCDLLHATAPIPLSSHAGSPVVTIHDLIPVIHPEWFPTLMGMRLRRWLKRAVQHASHIICDSHATAADLARVAGRGGVPVSVVYPGVEVTPPPASPAAPAGLRPYLLAVGTIEPRKNLDLVLTAYARLKRERQHVPALVIAGSQGWLAPDLAARTLVLGIAQDVVVTGYVTDEHLAGLYRDAIALVYPSFYEGFGFPPLEAMAHGCPVLASNSSSLPEVVGDAGLLVDPRDAGQLYHTLRLVLDQPALATALAQRGRERAATFTWERCARETIAVYRALGSRAA